MDFQAGWPVRNEHFCTLTFDMKMIYHRIGSWEKSVQAPSMSLEGYSINPGHKVPTPERSPFASRSIPCTRIRASLVKVTEKLSDESKGGKRTFGTGSGCKSARL